MDYSKLIKSILEESNLSGVLDELRVDRDSLANCKAYTNICCSNGSYVFIYLEQTASFLALSLDRLCKSEDKSFIKSFQRLNINAAPIGTFKNIQISSNGAFVLLTYDKSLTVVQLPSKYGKYGQYENGKSNIICKSVKFNLKNRITIIDAIWHPRSDEDCVVCLTSDHGLRFFSVSSPNAPVKEFVFSNVNFETPSTTDLVNNSKESKFLNIEIGARFEYNERYAYPIYVLKSNGQIDCLVEYDGIKKFKFIGPLTLVPYCMDYEENQVISFLCLPKNPNCIVLLLNNGVVYHCIFMPNCKSAGYESINFNEETSGDFNGEAFLFVYESIRLDEESEFSSIRFVKDSSNSSRYFACHAAGVHSIYLPWLENLQIIYEKNKNLSHSDFDDSEYCEISHILCTRAFSDIENNSLIIGSCILSDFSKSDRILITLTNRVEFICANVEIPVQNQKLKRSSAASENSDKNDSEDNDIFFNYIFGILKRNANFPIIRSDNTEVDEAELNLIVKNTLNLIKTEYIDRQKQVIIEFQKRSKILKKQEELQHESITDVCSKLELFQKNKTTLALNYERLVGNQEQLEKRIEEVLNKLLAKRQVPITAHEIEMFDELKAIRKTHGDFDDEIKQSKVLVSRIDTTKGEKSQLQLDEHSINQTKALLKNQSEKVKELMQKLELLKQTVQK